jgi:hypothetical protein
MGFKIEGFAEGMEDGDNAWDGIFVSFSPGKDRLSGELEHGVEDDLAVEEAEEPELFRQSEDDMAILNIRELGDAVLNPVIDSDFTAGRAEP